MLNFLRQNKDNFLIKIILGVITLSFAAFFGASSLAPSAPRGQAPATVNGEYISSKRFNSIVSDRLEQLQAQFKDQVPPNFSKTLGRQVLSQLINQELIHQELQKIGLKTTTDELIEYVKKSPQFQREGQFDLNFYEKRFLPGYQLSTGTSYEQDVMRELAQVKFFEEFQELVPADDKELENENWLSQAKLKFEVIAVPIADTLPEEKTGKEELTPKEKAEKTFTLWKSGKNIDDWLKTHRLTKKETPELTYRRIKFIFGGKGETKHLKSAIALTKKDPFPDAPIKEGNYYYLIKLVDMKKPESRNLETEQLAKMKESYQKSVTAQLQNSYIKYLNNKADVEVFGARQ